MSSTPALFIHGAGRSGREAWPNQRYLETERECRYLPRLAAGDPPELMIRHIVDVVNEPAHVLAHSYGGITALQLAEHYPDKVASLTLVEPAALSLSRHLPQTADHIAAMAPVFARAPDENTSDKEFSRLVGEANGSPVPEVPEDVLAGLVRQLRATVPPWEMSVDASVASRVPSFVAIGEQNTMYAEVAQVLTEHGAPSLIVPEGGHRPHDTAQFADALAEFWQTIA